MTAQQLDQIGHPDIRWRRYLWAQHFITLGQPEAARWFVGKLYRIAARDWPMPMTWLELQNLVDPARPGGEEA